MVENTTVVIYNNNIVEACDLTISFLRCVQSQ